MLVLFFFLFSSATMSGNQYHFRTLSPEGGFSYDGVMSIQQDSDGFIWVLMENNLYRFDGYQYKHYSNHFTNLNNTVEWIFKEMKTNQAGKLFVNTNNGLYTYDKVTDTFHLIWPEKIETFTTNNDIIWIKHNKNWKILDIEHQKLYTPLFDGKEAPDFIGSVSCSNNGNFYVFSNYGKIYRFNDSKKEFSLCMKLPDTDQAVLKASIYKGKLWVLVKKSGLYKIDLSSFSIEAHFDFFNEYGENTTVRAFYIDKNGKIWFGTFNGLYILDPETGEYTHHIHSESDPFSLPNNSVWTINEDREKNIWIGVFSGHICYLNPEEKNPFKTYSTREGQLNFATVSSFAEANNRVWIGTDGGGISVMDKQAWMRLFFTKSEKTDGLLSKQSWMHLFSTKSEKTDGLSSNNVKSIVIDKEQNIWIATYMGGLNCYNQKTKQFRNFKHDPEKNSLISNSIRKIILESDSGLWITYQQKQLMISFLSFKDNTFTHYDLSDESGDITILKGKDNTQKNNKETYIFDILRGRENQLWILTRKKLYLIDIKKHTINEVESNNTVFTNFSSFCFDDSGNLWIGTLGNGLVKYNPYVKDYSIYKDIINYGVSSIYSVCSDDERNIWMGTDNGLVRYDITNNNFSRYDKQDGTQGLVYNSTGFNEKF